MELRDKSVLVTGAGGFIGGWLVKDLREKGVKHVRAVDNKSFENWYQKFDDVENRVSDLQKLDSCTESVKDIDYVFNLAADMGGMGFIENNKAACMISVLINTHLLLAAKSASVERFFYSSSACVYNAEKQTNSINPGLKESDAYPALPEDGYGWEKLFSERMCRHFNEDFNLITRVARFHNVYGPHGTYRGGREKAPAAICRKVAEAKIFNRNSIDIWGDGEQTRSFTYIDDTIFGTHLIMNSSINEPLNLGSSELVSINELVSIVERIAGIELDRNYKLDAPKGVRGRNSDNSKIKTLLNWEPSISLEKGFDKTYTWIYNEILKKVSK